MLLLGGVPGLMSWGEGSGTQPDLSQGVPYHVTYPMLHLMFPSPPCEQTDACANIRVFFITGRNEVVAKVMFLHVSVILLTGWVSGEPPPRPGRHTPPWTRQTPPWQGEPPWTRHTPPAGRTPRHGDPPGRETPPPG